MDERLKPPEEARDDAERQSVKPTQAEAEEAVRTLIRWAGDNPDRDGLIDTPERVVRAYGEFYSGYAQDSRLLLERTFEEDEGYDDLVLVRDIPFASHCEHHMVPFMGKAHIAYFPTERVVGLSKLGRVVDIYARRLQTQEHLTAQILNAITEQLKPRGAAVMIEAEHLCMTIRGAHKHGSSTVTTQFTGVFRDDPAEQTRFLGLVQR